MPNIILKINSTTDKIHTSEDICCYLINSGLPSSFIKDLAGCGKMLLLIGDNAAQKCKEYDADGIVVEIDPTQPLKVQVNKPREMIGPKKVCGVIVPAHRHEAMLAAETEPDFVAFKFAPEETAKAAEIIAWYNDLFLIQSAADLSSGLQNIADIDIDFMIINSQDYKDFGC